MPPYVGMARKQNGGFNASISVLTPIFHLVVNSTRLKTVRSARWCCPNSVADLGGGQGGQGPPKILSAILLFTSHASHSHIWLATRQGITPEYLDPSA